MLFFKWYFNEDCVKQYIQVNYFSYCHTMRFFQHSSIWNQIYQNMPIFFPVWYLIIDSMELENN